MALGPNRFYLHEYAHQLVDSTFPGMTFGSFRSHFDRMNTWTKQSIGWSQHLVRSSLLLRNAVKVTEVACFVGEELSASVTDYRYQSLHYLMTHHPVSCHHMSHYLFPLPITD